jgi:hypothetical protein
MGTGLVLEDVMAMAQVGELWGMGSKEGEEEQPERRQECPSHREKAAGKGNGETQARAQTAGEGARATRKSRATQATAKAAGRNVRATEAITAKRRGEMAEAVFMAKAAQLGFGVAKPWGDSDPYDFIVNVGGRLWRVQVKSAHRAGPFGNYYFCVYGHAQRTYGPKEIDVLVAYVVPEDAWYVFPVSVVQKLRSLQLFPGSRRGRSKFEKYREAWGLFGG